MRPVKITDVIAILQNGGIGVMPTDTIYGIVARAHDQSAVERVCEVKKREKGHPFIVLISDIERVVDFGVHLSDVKRDLLRDIWCSDISNKKDHNDVVFNSRPTSVVIPCDDDHFAYIHQGQRSIGFRLVQKRGVAQHDVLYDVMQQVGPMIATSVNISGQPFATTIEQARRYFGDQCDFYMEAKHELSSQPSVIISLMNDHVEVIRA